MFIRSEDVANQLIAAEEFSGARQKVDIKYFEETYIPENVGFRSGCKVSLGKLGLEKERAIPEEVAPQF